MSIRPSLRRRRSFAIICALAVLLSGHIINAGAPKGDIDTSFDGDGKKTIDFGFDDQATAVAVQPDGKVVAVGFLDGGTADFGIVRLNRDGSPDASFPGEGLLAVDHPGSSSAEFANAVAVQPDGKIVVAGYTNGGTGLGANDFMIARINADGTPDMDFGIDGIQTVDFGADDRATGVAIQRDGGIVVVGSTDLFLSDFAVARLYGDDGGLDTSFSDDGRFAIAFGGEDFASAVALDEAGNIVVVGRTNARLNSLDMVAVARVTPSGGMDTTFDGDGMATFPLPVAERATAVAIQPDGRIVIAGNSIAGADRVLIMRLTASGALDPDTVGGNGAAAMFGGNYATGLTLLHDGRIALSMAGIDGMAVAMLNRDLLADQTFAPEGRRIIDFGDNAQANAIAVQPDGQLVLAGYTDVSGNGPNSFRVVRVGADPPLDLTFDLDGRQTTDLGGQRDQGRAVLVEPGGKVVVAGTSLRFDASGTNWRNLAVLTRYAANGAVDGGFGLVESELPGMALFLEPDFVAAVARQPDGKIVVAGSAAEASSLTVRDIIVWRFNSDGSPDAGFNGGSGKAVIDFGFNDTATGVVVQADGKIVVGGSSNDGHSDFVIARLLPSGLPDTTFANGGQLRIDFPGADSDEVAQALLLQPDGKLVIAGSTNSGTSDIDFAIARVTSAGVLDSTFDGDGRQTTSFGTTLDAITSLALQPDSKIVAAGWGGTPAQFLVVRYTATGSLDPSFSGDGKLTFAFGPAETHNDEKAYGVAVQPNGRIVVVGDSDAGPGPRGNFAAARLTAAGGLDQSFHDAGKLLIDLGGEEHARGVVFDPTTGSMVVAGWIFESPEGERDFAVVRLIADATPGVTITSPPPTPTPSTTSEVTVSFLPMAGTAAGIQGVTSVTWSNDRGGSGTASGTTNWRIADVPLAAGANNITVTAHNAAGSSSQTLTVNLGSLVYSLAEGATGPFFDYDLLLANPTGSSAPVTIDYLKPGGETLQQFDTIEANSRKTIRVDNVAPTLSNTAVSTVVTSTSAVPLVVERSMYWNDGYYGGHAGSSVPARNTTWLFAEGSQGFFDTYVLLANSTSTAADVTVTFLLESDAPVVKNFTVGPTSRENVYAGSIQELINKSFSIVVSSTVPIIAERAMYFGAPLFNGGHETAGVNAASTTWFLAEGATGSFFDTYVLIGNPNAGTATVTMTFLTGTGQAITRVKTIPGNTRLTVNVEVEDAALADAAVSTTVSSDLPVIAERAMYWPGPFTSWYEAHDSFGVTQLATKWGLAEGRSGGPRNFQTYILLANPSTTTAAEVTVTYLETDGTTIVKNYTVNPTSRFNIDVNAFVPELNGLEYGALIEVTNSVPIAVERAVYNDSAGVFWAAGTNATAVRVP